jgi:predicted dehydrogenase
LGLARFASSQYFEHKDEGRGAWRSVHVTDSDHPYMGNGRCLASKSARTLLRPSGRGFSDGVAKGKPASHTFRDALETQYICDAVQKSAKTERWEKCRK